ncbi:MULTISPECIES: PLP-dependent aminotransferase family protein [unclassified Mycolicibacterium]|uniref:MocR-like pyridoxine biosynthesis transcription factor PdxR n=3 Tax=Mycolicibacterium TaxID=1866885 RepID=UPI002815F11A|nr:MULTISPECIES: PLP-dependent aminotransferase family protein [unclassified Mycolicibacterium]
MVSWANSEADGTGLDLHLDLGQTVSPGRRGTRDQLIRALRDAVRSGRLPAGTMLPASRSLATDLGLARNTVAESYAELVAEGWLAARQGAGTWVVGAHPEPTITAPRGRPPTPIHNLMPGSGNVAAFPRQAWLTSARRALTNAPTEALRTGDSRGRPELRSAVAAYLARARGVRTSPESIVICAGTRHAVELLSKVFAPNTIAVEAYGLYLFRDAIGEAGAGTVPIRIDDHGAVVADLENTIAAAVLLTPAHHFPHGVPLHPTRRTQALDWAKRTKNYVLEDDYDGEFRYDRQPIGSMQGLDPDRVVYLGSVSKSLSPVLRLGWMVLPDSLIDPVLAAAGGQQFYVNAIDQLTMADFIESGHYDKHIRRMRNSYRHRRDALTATLADLDVEISGLSAGLHALIRLPDGTEHEAIRRAADAGIALSGLALLRHPDATAETPHQDGVVVSFGTPADHEFNAALDALHDVLAAVSR